MINSDKVAYRSRKMMSGEINTDFGNQMINDNAKSFVVEVEVEA